MRFKILTAFLLLTAFYSHAQSVNDSLILKDDMSSEIVSADLDSLVNTWYVQLALENLNSNLPDSMGKELPDSVYRDRLKSINSIINLPYNSVIRNSIHVYTIKRRKNFSAVLGLSDYYFPMIENILDSYGLPAELKYMAVIESALIPNIVNRRSGATGLWQFMYSTGRMYGLTINSVVDERRDPVKSTHAAARYFRDLYKIYNDWTLVIAAFNCGPGTVNKAIQRSGNKKDYWDIYYRLPRETRGYIPIYVAAAYALNFYNEHGLKPLPVNIPLATDTIMVNRDYHLSQISQVMRLPIEELKALNPQYKTGLIPGASKPMSLTLPLSKLGDFITMDDTIRNFKPDQYLKKETQIADPKHFAAQPTDIKGKTKIIYTVQDGDNLGYIAEWYRVSLSDLRYWNDIYRNTIRIGQKIAVYVDQSKADHYSRVNMMTFAEKQQFAGKTVAVASPLASQGNTVSPSTANSTFATLSTDDSFVTHTVRSGDTIWDIVKLYENVTASQVLALNNITEPGKIKVGQVLKIKKKS